MSGTAAFSTSLRDEEATDVALRRGGSRRQFRSETFIGSLYREWHPSNFEEQCKGYGVGCIFDSDRQILNALSHFAARA